MNAEQEQARNLRPIYKSLDDSIDKFIYSIKYPANTSFVKKLLRRPPKIPYLEMMESIATMLPDVIDDIRGQILQDGGSILSPKELNSLIYERISQKFGKQFKLGQDAIDEVFRSSNSNIVRDLEAVLYAKMDDGPQAIADGMEEAKQKLADILLPPHLVNWDQEGLFKSEDMSPAGKKAIAQLLESHILTLSDQLSDAKMKGDRGAELAVKSIEEILKIEDYILSRKPPLPHRPMVKDKRAAYEQELESHKAKWYKELQEHNIKLKHFPKKHLTKFEVAGIDLMKKVESGITLTDSEQNFMASFLEYATDNKSFNSRLGRIIKSGQVKSELGSIYSKALLGKYR